MKHVFLTILLSIGFLNCSCRSLSSAKKNQSAKQLFHKAEKLKKTGYYKEALLTLQKIKSRYLYSPFFKEADLMAADIYFLQKEWAKAETAYAVFSKMYSHHSQAPRVFFKRAVAGFKRLPTGAERDLSLAPPVVKLFQKQLKIFPHSPYKKQSRAYIKKIQKLLAQREWMIASFHLKRGRAHSAGAYLKTLLLKYPHVLPKEISSLKELKKLLKKAHKQANKLKSQTIKT